MPEHHLDSLSHRTHCTTIEVRAVEPAETEGASGRLDQAQDAGSGATAFSDEAVRLAPACGEADMLEGMESGAAAAAGDGEPVGQP